MDPDNSMHSKIKICHIITKLELGGAQQVTLDTLRFLDPDKFERYLITHPEGKLVPDAEGISGLEIFFVPDLVREIKPLRDFRAFFEIKKILRKISPDIVHTHSSKAGVAGRAAARIARVPIVVHTYHGFSLHDFQSPVRRKLYALTERFAARYSTHNFAVSNANIEKGIGAKIFKPGDCKLTRDAVHTAIFKKEKPDPDGVKKEFNIPSTFKIVGMIACFKPQKAPEDFVYIAKEISMLEDDIRFLLVGDGILRKKLERLILSLNLEDKIILTSWRDDIPRLIRSFDVLALTSLHEGLPMVIPQAMSSGIPVVVSDVDGAGDIVRDSYNGFLVKPKDIGEFSKKILMLLENKALAKKFARNGLLGVDEFDIHAMVKAQSSFYEETFRAQNSRKS